MIKTIHNRYDQIALLINQQRDSDFDSSEFKLRGCVFEWDKSNRNKIFHFVGIASQKGKNRISVLRKRKEQSGCGLCGKRNTLLQNHHCKAILNSDTQRMIQKGKIITQRGLQLIHLIRDSRHKRLERQINALEASSDHWKTGIQPI